MEQMGVAAVAEAMSHGQLMGRLLAESPPPPPAADAATDRLPAAPLNHHFQDAPTDGSFGAARPDNDMMHAMADA